MYRPLSSGPGRSEIATARTPAESWVSVTQPARSHRPGRADGGRTRMNPNCTPARLRHCRPPSATPASMTSTRSIPRLMSQRVRAIGRISAAGPTTNLRRTTSPRRRSCDIRRPADGVAPRLDGDVVPRSRRTACRRARPHDRCGPRDGPSDHGFPFHYPVRRRVRTDR